MLGKLTAYRKHLIAPRVYEAHGADHQQCLNGLPLASFRSRFLAYLIDFALIVPVFALIEIGRLWFSGELNKGNHVIALDLRHIESLIYLVVYFGLITYFTQGRSLGKWIVGIRVVSLLRPRITLWQSIERALGYGVSTAEGGFGFLQYFIYPNRTCAHDRLAETIVVRNRPPVRIPVDPPTQATAEAPNSHQRVEIPARATDS